MTPNGTAHWTTPTGHTRTTHPTDAGCVTPPDRTVPTCPVAGTAAIPTPTPVPTADDDPPPF